jgi:hypothetical protein
VPDPLPWWRIAAPLGAFILLGLACRARPLPLLRVVWLTSLGMIGYAMLQDQISARLCPEYFTIGHPPIPGLADPTLLGLAWGFLGGFPGGILLGVPVALAARWGRAAPLPAAALIRPLGLLLAGTAAGTLAAGASAWYNSRVANIAIGPPWSVLIPPERQRAFFVVASAHFATYLSAAILGAALCGWIVRRRLLAR